jgi:hypothetical protein
MEYFKRFKKDKSFRNKVIIGIVISLFILNSSNDVGTQAFYDGGSSQSKCDECGGGLFNLCDPVECVLELGCVYDDSITNDCKAGLDFSDQICKGTYLENDYPSIYPGAMCKSPYVPATIESPGLCSLFGGKAWKCVTQSSIDTSGASSPICSKSWQQPLSDMLDSIWENDINSCSTKSYLVIGAIGAIILAVV